MHPSDCLENKHQFEIPFSSYEIQWTKEGNPILYVQKSGHKYSQTRITQNGVIHLRCRKSHNKTDKGKNQQICRANGSFKGSVIVFQFNCLGTIRSSREKAEMFWDQIMIDKPEVFGEENPFNELIKRAQKDAFGLNQC